MVERAQSDLENILTIYENSRLKTWYEWHR
jgi:hypothetical protein